MGHERIRSALTWSQRGHLEMLLKAGALSRETSLNIYQLAAGGHALNANVAGILDEKGFLERKARTSSGGQRCMHYWLTEGGAVIARQILQGEI